MSERGGDEAKPDAESSNTATAPRHSGERTTKTPGKRPRGRVVGALRAIGTGILAGLLILFVGIGIAAIVVPAVTGSTALTVKTSSMEPSLPAGTMIVVRPTAIEDIQTGAVLTYQITSGDPTLVTHRVVQRQEFTSGETVFITKGDANNQPDADPVREVQIKGTVWYAIPYLGWVTAFVTGEARAIVVPLAVGALLAYAAWMAFSALRDRGKKRRDAAAAEASGAAADSSVAAAEPAPDRAEVRALADPAAAKPEPEPSVKAEPEAEVDSARAADAGSLPAPAAEFEPRRGRHG